MITPAGRPCRVMTISSAAASRKYFDRSSLTLARATALTGRAFLVEPGLGFLFFDDREDFDCSLGNVIEHPDVVDPEAILRLPQPPEPLDATLAGFGRLESKMALKRIPDLTADMGGESLQRLGGIKAPTRSRTAFWLDYSQI